MLTCSSLLVTLLTFALTQGGAGHQQTISTKLFAPWKSTSILAEAAEYVADLEANLYWRFVNDLMDKLQHFPAPNTEDGEMDLASVVAFNLISPSKLRLMEWTLRSRTYSPKVLSLQQLVPNVVPEECEDAFVVLGSLITCSPSELKSALEKENVAEDDHNSLITENDHKYPSLIWTRVKVKAPPVAVLFAKLTSHLAREFHSILKQESSRVGYILRPYDGKLSTQKSADKLLLAGYGVELQFKSQEYKAQDDSNSKKNETTEVAGFLFDKLHELYPDVGEELDKFQNYLATGRGQKAEFEALKAWQVQELGLQASHYTTLQDNFLDALLDVSGNFPSRAASLSSIRVPSDFKRSVAYNQRLLSSHFNVEEGEGAFFLQGAYIDPDSLDLFSFMDNLKGELGLMELVRSLRHERADIKRSDVDRILSLGTKSSSEPELALDLRDSSIFWINDLEKDEEYEDWPDDLTQLFFRMGGIMLRPVRRNVFNLVLNLDPVDTVATGGLLKMAQSFMAHKSPVRIGVVFCSNGNDPDDRATLIRRAMNYGVSEGKTKLIFNEIVQGYLADDFSKLVEKRGNLGEEFDFGAELACDFVKRSGRPNPAGFLNGIPLKWDSLDDFEEVVLNQLLKEAQTVQIEAYNGRVNEDTDIFEYLMNKPNVQTRLNDKILDGSNSKWMNFGAEIWELGKEIKQNALGRLASTLNYLTPSGKRKSPITVTIWAFSDLATADGRAFLETALQFMAESATHARLAFVSTSEFTSELIRKVEKGFLHNDIKAIQSALADSDADSASTLENNEKGLELMTLLGLSPQAKGVLVNGRLIGPLDSSETFELGDWSLIQKFTYDACPKHLEGEEWESDSVMRLCAALGSQSTKKSSKRFTLPEFQSPFYIGRESGTTNNPDVFHVDLVAVIDPASRHAHKMAALLSAVQHTLGQWVHTRVVFNPPSKHSELPLKSYYRYVAGHKSAETIVFENIPRDPLFTQNIFAPDNWMVEVVKCEKDLDNIRLRDLGGESVLSEYELEHLLVEGHCLESKSGSPPRGLQFILTPQNPSVKGAETIVMANLGYFQLKAKPGLWTLGLREGPSREIYALESQTINPISVNSFQSVVIKVKVKRNAGKETASLLDSEQESSGWFGFGSKKTEVEEETINVFSVASGHLYERVLRIMMLSVLKNTKSKVKFWFLKNYLSPSLKDILPEMAVEYGFEYELVQYHWPRWLNPQREKQRIIWGYKILFLDVLFPLSLKKIVFVDADQVVRADLKELFDLDLEGNPYGYAPFCDSRTEMEGFRFWKQGYWKSHLGRRKYHISALYVVDLVRFRRIAAGDRLRGQYQALSQDPNSLSNLDQDLPNNMIHQVGIKSLPQEWLWCETWCDDASKKNAKTIDLCNNPQTKEPKLDAAQRIVPEWKDYDQEIRDFQLRLQERSDSSTSPESPKDEL